MLKNNSKSRHSVIIDIILILGILLSSCQTFHKSESLSYFSTNDYIPYLLNIKFTIELKVADIGKYGNFSDGFFIDYARSRIQIFLLEYSSTVDSAAMSEQIENGSLGRLLIEHVNELPRLEGSKMKSVKIIELDPS